MLTWLSNLISFKIYLKHYQKEYLYPLLKNYSLVIVILHLIKIMLYYIQLKLYLIIL